MRRGGTALAVTVALGGALAGPARGDVHIGINIGPPPIVVAEPPRLVVVPRSPVYWAPSLPYNFFYYGGRYWTYHEDGWFSAGSVHGPWVVIDLPRVPRPVLAVPIAYYRVPPGHWKRMRRGGPPPWAGRGHGPHRHSRGHGHGKHGKHGKHD
jgi:hypothetical protein